MHKYTFDRLRALSSLLILQSCVNVISYKCLYVCTCVEIICYTLLPISFRNLIAHLKDDYH